MSEQYLTAKEFAAAAGVSAQTIYKQMNSRLAPYVKQIKGQKAINIDALKEFYDIEEPQDPELTTGSTQAQPNSNLVQSDPPLNQSETNSDDQLRPTLDQPNSILEKRVEELESLLKKQLEEDKQEKEFLREQIRQKDKTIESLTENLRIAQQLAAADKKKLLEIEQKQQQEEKDKEIESPAAEPSVDQEQSQADQVEKKPRGIKAFFGHLFG